MLSANLVKRLTGTLRASLGHVFKAAPNSGNGLRAIEFLISRNDLSGAVNLASPNPLPNREMMRVLRQTCGVPFGLPAAKWMLDNDIIDIELTAWPPDGPTELRFSFTPIVFWPKIGN